VFREVSNRSSYGYGWPLVYAKVPPGFNKVNLDFWASVPREKQDSLRPIKAALYDELGFIHVVECDVKGSVCSRSTIAFGMGGLIPKLKIYDPTSFE
jgi:hypothetical protein